MRRKVQVARHDHAVKGKIRVIVVAVVVVVVIFVPMWAASKGFLPLRPARMRTHAAAAFKAPAERVQAAKEGRGWQKGKKAKGTEGTSQRGKRRRRGGTAQHRTAREPEMVVVGDKEGFPSLAGGIRGMSILHP